MAKIRRTETKDIETMLESMYDVADVKTGFRYWFFKLLGVCLNMFEYDGLPDTLPQRELESQLLLTGHAVVFLNKGDLVTTITHLGGVGKYYEPTFAVWAQPKLGSGKFDFKDDTCALIYNNNLRSTILNRYSDGSMLTFIGRYARQLSDIESTINIYNVNTRLTSIPVSSNNKVTASIKAFFNKLRMGHDDVVVDEAIVSAFRNVDVTKGNVKDGVNDLLIARDKVLEQFYRDLGVKFTEQKKAQVTEDEVNENEQVLLIQPDDMLKSRKEGVEEINRIFGLHITVKLNEKFDRKTYTERGVNDVRNDESKTLLPDGQGDSSTKSE